MKQSSLGTPVYNESSYIPIDVEIARQNRCAGLFPEEQAMGTYKMLRTRINQVMKANGWKTLMVTSVLPHEGKTLTSINLALTFAKEFMQTVMLIDCDLKRQSVHKYLGIKSGKGLADHLTAGTELKDLIIWPGIERLTIISGETTLEDSAEYLNSPRMHALVEETKKRYSDRYIIFDTPPVLGAADTVAFSPLADAILLVTEAGKTTSDDIEKAIGLLPEGKIIGTVLNRKKHFKSNEYLNFY